MSYSLSKSPAKTAVIKTTKFGIFSEAEILANSVASIEYLELFEKGSYCLGHDILFHDAGESGCPLCAIDKGDLVEKCRNLQIDLDEANYNLARRRHI